jgi:quinol monooxygenase YgiN
MILATMRMNSGGDAGMFEALRDLSDVTAGRPGCRGCEVLQQPDRPEMILYIEQWSDWDSLRAHMKSATYAYLLQVLEMSKDRPEVQFRELGVSHGLEFVEAVRLGHVKEAPPGSSRPLTIAG